MIAVMIFLIVSVIIAIVFRTTLLSYKKGNAYTELYQGLSGAFMIIQDDLKRIAPVNDEDNVKFEPDYFSFIATSKDDNNFTILELIKYIIDNNALTRNSVKYPIDKGKIDQDPVDFLKPIDETFFSYIYSKSESDTGDDKKSKEKKSDDGSQSLNNVDKEAGSDTEKEKDIKLPFAIGVEGKIKSDDIVKHFKNEMFVSIYIPEKSSGSDTSTESDTQKNNSSNSK